MPYTYTKHFNDYRRDRRNTLPKRNIYPSMINPISGNLITLEWEGQRYRLDKEVEIFRYKQAMTKKLIEVYKKEVSRLSKIINQPLYICTNGNSHHAGSQKFWLHASKMKESLSSHIKKREAKYYSEGSRIDRACHASRDAKGTVWRSIPSTKVRAESESFRMSCVKRWSDDEPYLFRIDIDSIDVQIEAIKAYRERVSEDTKDFEYFCKAYYYEGLNWMYSISDLHDDNPYKQFRIDFEAEVQKVRYQKKRVEAKLEPLVESWNSYYCDEKNLEARQDELDKKYRYRVERKKEIRESLKQKRRVKRELKREQLVAEVEVEMKQWKDDIHSGKATCGCTSSPNSEGVRALKKHYSTLEDATEGARNALLKSGLHLRPYKCPVKQKGRDGRHYKCGGYHLTKFEG